MRSSIWKKRCAFWITLIGFAVFPLFALLAFGLVQAGVYELASREVPGVGVLRAMPAFWDTHFVSRPTDGPYLAGRRFFTYGGSVGMVVLRDLWYALSLDPNVVGATRREALWMVGSGYAAAVLICTVSVAVGLLVGGWLCRLLYRPSYWTVGVVKHAKAEMLRASVLPAVLWGYAVAVVLAAANVLLVDTYGTGMAYAMPSMPWGAVLLSAPAMSGAAVVMREYARIVRSRVGAGEYLCDCDYGCPPGQVCPECGNRTRELPATLRWHLPRLALWKTASR